MTTAVPLPDLAAPRLDALRSLVSDPAAFRDKLPDTPGLHSTGGDFRALLDVTDVEELLTSRSLRRPAFRLIRDGKQVPDAECLGERLLYPDVADPRKVAGLLRAGATLVLQALQELHAPCGDFARRLAHDLGRPINVNAYLTPAGAQGFADHYDVQDSFIVQVRGTKDWTLYEPVLRDPLSSETFDRVRARVGGTVVPEGAAPWREVTLRPGDCLWLPRGWVHSARSTDTDSLHLTISLYEWTGWWALSCALERTAELPGRFPVSADFFRDPSAAARDLARVRTELVTWLQEVDDAALAESVRTAALKEFPPALRHPVLTATAQAPGATAAYRVHPQAVLSAGRVGERIVLHLADRVLTVPAPLEELLRDVLSRDRFTPADLPDHPHRDLLLTRLVADGVLEPTKS
ncbi:JmjC domain-containing protein [Streptomyces sp. NPDC058294]|uniref:JmjC domain-containing protein n=1 Tax=Streptomyces sp. NPDC058294 TaxID=3346430 RepID=UPI0036E9B458